MARKQALSVTDAAAQRIQALLAKRGKPRRSSHRRAVARLLGSQLHARICR